MKLISIAVLTLAAFAAEAPKPKPLSKEEAQQARIIELEKKLSLEEVRSAWARTIAPQLDFQKALNHACEVWSITENCRWDPNSSTLVRVQNQQPQPQPVEQPKAAAPAKPAAKVK